MKPVWFILWAMVVGQIALWTFKASNSLRWQQTTT